MRFKDVNDWVENLKNAIILQAVSDYREAVAMGDARMKRECESFFRSRWYSELTDIDGEYLLRKLRSEAREAI